MNYAPGRGRGAGRGRVKNFDEKLVRMSTNRKVWGARCVQLWSGTVQNDAFSAPETSKTAGLISIQKS